MKYLLISLLIGCFISPAWGQERSMTLEEFVQKLGNAKPWTLEKVEAEFWMKFTYNSSTGISRSYIAYEPLPSVQNLILQYIEVTFRKSDNKPLYLQVGISSKLKCFTLEQIKKLYPNGSVNFENMNQGYFYDVEFLWGSISFSLDAYQKEKCIMVIYVSDKIVEEE